MSQEPTPAHPPERSAKLRSAGPVSKSTRYRRLKEAKELGIPVDELPDLRGRAGGQVRGANHYRWNHRIIDDQGYVKVRVGKDHPLANAKGYVSEHIMVWVSAGNPRPGSGEVIHHRDEDKSNNRISNLELKTRGDHNALHNADRGRDERGRLLPRAIRNAAAVERLSEKSGGLGGRGL